MVFVDRVEIVSVLFVVCQVLNRFVSVQVVENCVLLIQVRFFFVLSLIGDKFVCVSVFVLCKIVFLNLVLFFLIIIVVICDSGVKLLDVFIEFCVGIMGVMFLVNMFCKSCISF